MNNNLKNHNQNQNQNKTIKSAVNDCRKCAKNMQKKRKKKNRLQIFPDYGRNKTEYS